MASAISRISLCRVLLFLRLRLYIQHLHPLPLLRQARSLAEILVFLAQAAQTYVGSGRLIRLSCGLVGHFTAFQLAYGALDLPLFLRGLIGRVFAALELDGRRVDVGKLFVGVGAFGNALDKGVETMPYIGS